MRTRVIPFKLDLLCSDRSMVYARKTMDNVVWLSGLIVVIVVLTMLLSDRQAKLDRRIDALDRRLRLVPGLQELEKKLPEWQRLALDPSSKILAIKAYREQTGVGLAEAKDAVEKWMKEG
jgi:hypothetical protein